MSENKVIWHKVEWDDDGWSTDVEPKPGTVLVTTIWGDVAPDTIVNGKDGLYFDFYNESVAAWAELPAPYKKEM